MIKLNIFNSVTGSEYKNIEFYSEKTMPDGEKKKNVSLIYASNTTGKSSLSSIIERHFNNTPQIENRFNNIKSTLSVI